MEAVKAVPRRQLNLGLVSNAANMVIGQGLSNARTVVDVSSVFVLQGMS